VSRFNTLQEWLEWQERLHPKSIDLGLERVAAVADRLHCRRPANVVISVGGTNGKGSCVALLDAIYRQAGYRTACYTSPHILRYNERLRLQGEPVSEDLLCVAFDRVDTARGETTLTYFEFGTLAVLDIMTRQPLDVAILEVGLGGRLDAVNVVDADVAMLSSIDVDHVDWLGPDRDVIGREKAGIFRGGNAAVCGDPDPPESVLAEAARIGARLSVSGRDFKFERDGRKWAWHGSAGGVEELPLPALDGVHQLANAAAVLEVIGQLTGRLPVSVVAIRSGLQNVRLAGRVQTIPGAVEQVLDVSHNAHAARALAEALAGMPRRAATRAVIGMMKDKDSVAFAQALRGQVQHWYPVGLQPERACSADDLAKQLESVAERTHIHPCETVAQALQRLTRETVAGERLLVCGSFYTVAEWLSLKPDIDP
jgi:dihydrofolate synthase/folylpolyglutamate synthase